MDGGIALTKFRVPRLRGDMVPRTGLLSRLLQSVESSPITVVRAPGGSGKTVLLSQLCTSLAGTHHVLWIAVDADDNDGNRLFAALIQSLEPLALLWDADPRELVVGVAGGQAQARAGLAALVNALCTSTSKRIVIVLDDLHRLDNPAAYQLLEALIERLPEHVSVVIGTRVEPALPLARWRAHGELGELGPTDLRFDTAAAEALARRKLGDQAINASVPEILAHTDGWAVGVSMLLQGGARTGTQPTTGAGQSHLFAYLAQEILDELPQPLQEFALRTSILVELDPALCQAVTGRSDSQRVLRELYRRGLFLTSIDEVTPVLRFHDLFREFLKTELRRRHGDELAALHTRAAEAERIRTRAVHHYIEAQQWERALALITELGEELLLEGAIGTLERWFEQIPATVRATSPHVAYLNGACGWLRWDWTRARRDLPPAIAGLTAPNELPRRVRALFQLVDALNSSGDLAGARARLDEVEKLPLDDLGQAELALQRAWCLAPNGDSTAIVENMGRFVDFAARDPARICPTTAGHIHCLLVGIPQIAESFERFVAVAEQVREPFGRPWHLPLFAVDGWTRVWRGDRAGAERALAQADVIYHQFRDIRLMGERINQFRMLMWGLTRRVDLVHRMAGGMLEGLRAPELTLHRAVWERAYRHGLARFLWVNDDHAAWLTLTESLILPRSPVEWPFVDVAAQVVRGQRAILKQDWAGAIEALELATRDYARMRLPMIYSDPRVSLGYAWLRSGDATTAWRAFEPAWREAIDERGVGCVLMDSRTHVAALLDAMPSAVRDSVATRQLCAVLAQWVGSPAQPAPVTAQATAGGAASAGPLSEREREVLEMVASGASNKHIARKLDLSLHTVKRHICNILDKLDCDSRGQAADWLRRAAVG